MMAPSNSSGEQGQRPHNHQADALREFLAKIETERTDVTELDISSRGLQELPDSLSATLGRLEKLERLNLQDNHLAGMTKLDDFWLSLSASYHRLVRHDAPTKT